MFGQAVKILFLSLKGWLMTLLRHLLEFPKSYWTKISVSVLQQIYTLEVR